MCTPKYVTFNSKVSFLSFRYKNRSVFTKEIVFFKLVLIKLSLMHLFSKEQGTTGFKCHSPFNDLEEIHKSCVSCSLLPGLV